MYCILQYLLTQDMSATDLTQSTTQTVIIFIDFAKSGFIGNTVSCKYGRKDKVE